MCYYHSTCGGRTAARHEVWGGDSIPYLVPRPDVDASGLRYCQASKYSEWRQEWTRTQLAGILKRNLASAGVSPVPSFSAIQRMEVASRAACGRIRTLRIGTDKGEILVKGDKVRWALQARRRRGAHPAQRLVRHQGGAEGKVLAEGRAFGHGIGLCQFGHYRPRQGGPGLPDHPDGVLRRYRGGGVQVRAPQPPPRNFTISTLSPSLRKVPA